MEFASVNHFLIKHFKFSLSSREVDDIAQELEELDMEEKKEKKGKGNKKEENMATEDADGDSQEKETEDVSLCTWFMSLSSLALST